MEDHWNERRGYIEFSKGSHLYDIEVLEDITKISKVLKGFMNEIGK